MSHPARMLNSMGYPYEDLDDTQFERLAVQVARKLFGLGVQGFAAGPDGGRDARFSGTAQQFPSSSDPWRGITIFQAKHTNATNTHYSDAAFSGDSATSVLSEELPRIKKLVDTGEIDNYFLIANRRLGGVTASAIAERIAAGTGLKREQTFLVGTEYLDETLHLFPDIFGLARLDSLEGPLLVSSYELAEVILALANELEAPLTPSIASDIERVSYSEKNRLNGMTEEFARTLQKRYLSLTRQIETFLADPANQLAVRRYEEAVDELQFQIIAKRSDFPSFDAVFNHLLSTMVSRDGVLANNRRLTRAMLFYMYWHCDIGTTTDADTD